MNMKEIIESYIVNYYMNEQELIDNDADREIAEAIATEASIEENEE